jgi:hypothetical protein
MTLNGPTLGCDDCSRDATLGSAATHGEIAHFGVVFDL